MLAASALAGCAIDPATRLPVVNTAAVQVISDDVRAVQTVAQQVCGYIPAASSVIDIIASLAGAPGIGSIINTAAQGICAAVGKKAARRGLVQPTYRGVVIRRAAAIGQ